VLDYNTHLFLIHARHNVAEYDLLSLSHTHSYISLSYSEYLLSKPIVVVVVVVVVVVFLL